MHISQVWPLGLLSATGQAPILATGGVAQQKNRQQGCPDRKEGKNPVDHQTFLHKPLTYGIRLNTKRLKGVQKVDLGSRVNSIQGGEKRTSKLSSIRGRGERVLLHFPVQELIVDTRAEGSNLLVNQNNRGGVGTTSLPDYL